MAIDYTALGQRIADFRSFRIISVCAVFSFLFSLWYRMQSPLTCQPSISTSTVLFGLHLRNPMKASHAAICIAGCNRDLTDVFTHKGHFTGKVVHDGTKGSTSL